jgi:hypothetical protein
MNSHLYINWKYAVQRYVFIYFNDLARCLVLCIINVRILYHFGIQLFQVRLSTSKGEKSNTSANGSWESVTNECIFKAVPSSLSRSYLTFTLVFDFYALLVDNLNWNGCIRVSIHTDVWQICIDSVIGQYSICRPFYVNPYSKYLYVRFVICAGF